MSVPGGGRQPEPAVDEHHPCHPVGMADRSQAGHERTHGMPDQHRAVHAHRVQQGHRVGDVRPQPVRAGQVGAAGPAPQVGGEQRQRVGKLGGDPGERVPVSGDAVQSHDGQRLSRSPPGDGEGATRHVHGEFSSGHDTTPQTVTGCETAGSEPYARQGTARNRPAAPAR